MRAPAPSLGWLHLEPILGDIAVGHLVFAIASLAAAIAIAMTGPWPL